MQNERYLEAFLDESADNLLALSRGALELENSGAPDALFVDMFRRAHTLKGMCGAMGFENMARLTHRLEDDLERLRAHRLGGTDERMDLVFASIDILEKSLAVVRNTGHEPDDEWYSSILLRRSEVAATHDVPPAPSLVSQVPLHGEHEPLGSGRAIRSLRVPAHRVETLLNLMAELITEKSRLLKLGEAERMSEVYEIALRIDMLTTALYRSVVGLRMVPVETLFQRFTRLVHDLSKSLGKDIRFIVEGGGTEMDRAVVDELGEALVHLLRNAAYHGLETPEVRVAAGKSEPAHIRLSAFTSETHAYIEVCDNGVGINLEAITERAIEQGMVSLEHARVMTKAEKYALLFEPGFSTAPEVSGISGRGVGLDAVRDKVASLGGEIMVESEPSIGTIFRIKFPILGYTKAP